MEKGKWTKIMSVMTAVCLAMGIMTGCGTSGKEENNNDITTGTENEKTDDETTGTTDPTEEAEENKDENKTEHKAIKITKNDATCEEIGNKEYWQCTVCGKKYKEKECENEIGDEEIIIQAYEHEYGEVITGKESTCTENGQTYRECKRCSKRIDEREIKATGHEWGKGITVRQSTCEITGITEYVCNKCGETKREEKEKTEHEYTVRAVYATCTEQGYAEHECNKCGYKYTDEITETTEHKYETRIEEEPTCEKAGKEVTVCRICGEREESEITKTEHEMTYGECENCGYTEPYEYEKNENGTYTLKGVGKCKRKEIIIPNEYEGIAVTEIAEEAFGNDEEIQRVVIGENVKRIGKEAFYGCKNLTEVTFLASTGWVTSTTGKVNGGANIDVKKPTDNAKNLKGNIYGKLYWLKK